MNTFTKKTNKKKKNHQKPKTKQKTLFRIFYLHDTMADDGGQYFGCIAKSLSTSNSLTCPSACSSVFVPRPATTMIFTASMAVFFPWCSHTDVLEQLFPQHMPISILLLQWVFLGCSGTGKRISPSLLQPFSYYLVSASALPQKIIQTSETLLVF